MKLEKAKLLKLQKRGQANVNNKITYLVGSLIVVVLATALAPEMFANITNLSNNSDVPGWLPSVVTVVVGAGIVFLIWKTIGGNK